MTAEYVKWLNAWTGFYWLCRTNYWDGSKRKFLSKQSVPILDIDSEHLLRLKHGKDKVVVVCMATHRVAREAKPAPQVKLPPVAKDDFKKTLRDLHCIRGDHLGLANYPLAIEEEGTPA